MTDDPNAGWQDVTDPAEAQAALQGGAAHGPTTLSGDAFLKTLDPAKAGMVKAMAEGRQGLPAGYSMRSPFAQELLADTAQYDPTFDAANLPARVANRKAFTSGKQGQSIVALNTAIGHTGTLAEAAEDLQNRSFPMWNSVANAAETATGDPRVTNFNLVKQAAIDEAQRVFKQTGGNLHEIEEWEQTINSSRSPDQLRGAVSKLGELYQSRIGALHDSYNQGMGTTDQELPLLDPHAADTLAHLQSPDYLAKGYGAIKNAGAPVIAAPGGQPPAPSGRANPGNGGNGSPPPPSAPSSPPAGPPGGAPPAAAAAPSSTVATGSSRNELDAAKSAQLETLIRNGAPMEQINAVAPGTDPAQVQAVRDYLTKHPDYSGFAQVMHDVPNTIVNRIAASAPVAAATQFGDSVTLGTMPKLVAGTEAIAGRLTGDNHSLGDLYSSDLADVEHSRDASAAAHPVAALGGNMAGFLVGDAAIGKVAKAALGGSRIAAIPSLLRPVVGDALYGGAYGAGSSDHLADIPGNVLGGAALSVAGGAAGRGILKTGAALAKPLVSDAARRMTDAGITLTPGQFAGATGTKIGSVIKSAEDKATSIPIIGDAINMARRGGVEDFNRATGNKVLASIDQTLPKDVPAGHAMIQHLQNAVSDAYDKALTPLRANADQQLGSDFATIKSAVRPDQQDAFEKVVNSVVKPHLPSGNDPITGSQLQMIKRGLNEKIAQFKGDANGADLAGDLEDLRDTFMQFAERADPKNAAAYRAADAANAKLKRVETAAAGPGAKDGVFSPQQFRSAIGRRGYGTTTAKLAAGTAPMQELATDASTILPSTVPDSGTGGRLLFNQAARHLVPAALGGGAGALSDGKEGAIYGAALGAGLYSRPGLQVTQKILAGSRGKVSSTLGDLLRANSGLGGAAGSPILLGERNYR